MFLSPSEYKLVMLLILGLLGLAVIHHLKDKRPGQRHRSPLIPLCLLTAGIIWFQGWSIRLGIFEVLLILGVYLWIVNRKPKPLASPAPVAAPKPPPSPIVHPVAAPILPLAQVVPPLSYRRRSYLGAFILYFTACSVMALLLASFLVMMREKSRSFDNVMSATEATIEGAGRAVEENVRQFENQRRKHWSQAVARGEAPTPADAAAPIVNPRPTVALTRNSNGFVDWKIASRQVHVNGQAAIDDALEVARQDLLAVLEPIQPQAVWTQAMERHFQSRMVRQKNSHEITPDEPLAAKMREHFPPNTKLYTAQIDLNFNTGEAGELIRLARIQGAQERQWLILPGVAGAFMLLSMMAIGCRLFPAARSVPKVVVQLPLRHHGWLKAAVLIGVIATAAGLARALIFD